MNREGPSTMYHRTQLLSNREREANWMKPGEWDKLQLAFRLCAAECKVKPIRRGFMGLRNRNASN